MSRRHEHDVSQNTDGRAHPKSGDGKILPKVVTFVPNRRPRVELPDAIAWKPLVALLGTLLYLWRTMRPRPWKEDVNRRLERLEKRAGISDEPAEMKKASGDDT